MKLRKIMSIFVQFCPKLPLFLGVGQNWTKKAGQNWTKLDIIGQNWTKKVGQNWTKLDKIGLGPPPY